MVDAAVPGRSNASTAVPTGRLRSPDPVWLTFSLVAAVLVAVGAFLPLWKLELVAPQYPAGLYITAYGYEMTGDVDEVNELNHYVGLKPLKPDEILELKLFPLGVSGVVIALAAGGFLLRRRRTRAVSVALAWTLPVFTLADLQYWLYDYGHDINPDAALDLDPFTPRVLGTTQVLNFHSIAHVAVGFWLMVAAALLVSVGPWLARWLWASWKNTGPAGKAVAATLLVAITLAGSEKPANATAPTIGEAIARATPGDTVRIPAGIYREQVVIDKPVVLIGEGRPVIDGERRGDVVVITAEGVTVRGFDIRGSGRDVSAEPAGVRVTASRSTIEDNRVHDVLYGIVLWESDGHTVRGNTVESVREFASERRGHTMYLHYTNHNIIEGNTLTYGKDGMFLGFSDYNTIRDNVVTDLRYGVHYMYASHNELIGNTFSHNVTGGVLMYSTDVKFIDNDFSYNRSIASGYGIMFKDVDDIELHGNMIHHNRLGLALEGSPFTPGAFVTVRDNFIGYNQVAVAMLTTTHVTFTGNSFVGNLQQVEAVAGSLAAKNVWSADGRGNYWDDYRGYDADGDGVGDIRYEYQGAFDDLVKRNDAVRAWDHTPSRMALDLAVQLFPSFRPDARAIDDYPLMKPPVSLPRHHAGGDIAAGAAFAAGLLAAAALLLGAATRSPARRWQRC